jgi:hypothetical protein
MNQIMAQLIWNMLSALPTPSITQTLSVLSKMIATHKWSAGRG